MGNLKAALEKLDQEEDRILARTTSLDTEPVPTIRQLLSGLRNAFRAYHDAGEKRQFTVCIRGHVGDQKELAETISQALKEAKGAGHGDY